MRTTTASGRSWWAAWTLVDRFKAMKEKRANGTGKKEKLDDKN